MKLSDIVLKDSNETNFGDSNAVARLIFIDGNFIPWKFLRHFERWPISRVYIFKYFDSPVETCMITNY